MRKNFSRDELVLSAQESCGFKRRIQAPRCNHCSVEFILWCQPQAMPSSELIFRMNRKWAANYFFNDRSDLCEVCRLFFICVRCADFSSSEISPAFLLEGDQLGSRAVRCGCSVCVSVIAFDFKWVYVDLHCWFCNKKKYWLCQNSNYFSTTE